MKSKRWFQSRTIWFNVASFILTLSTALLASPEVKESWVPVLMGLQAVGNLILRLNTSQAVN